MSPDGLEQRLRFIPKAELHLHLEGSLTPATLWRLAQRQGMPWGLASAADCEQLYRFTDFPGFIQAIKTASQLLRDPGDYAEAVVALAQSLQAEGVVYAEVFFSVGILLWRGVAIEPYWEAMEAARTAAEAATGVRLRWLFDAVRQFGAAPFEAVVEWAVRLAAGRGTPGGVIGIGIGGDEAQVEATAFARGFARARAAGLHTTIHAGETCGPESIWAALRHLSPERIGHGLRAFEDPALMDELARRGVALDICPTSNLKTGAWRAGARPYPAHAYLNCGIAINIASDDPGIFGCTLLGEYGWLAQHGGFGGEELLTLARASLGRGFEPPPFPLASAPHPGGNGGMAV